MLKTVKPLSDVFTILRGEKIFSMAGEFIIFHFPFIFVTVWVVYLTLSLIAIIFERTRVPTFVLEKYFSSTLKTAIICYLALVSVFRVFVFYYDVLFIGKLIVLPYSLNYISSLHLLVDSFPMFLVLYKLSFINITIDPFVSSSTMFGSSYKLSKVGVTIAIKILTVTLFFILGPEPFIHILIGIIIHTKSLFLSILDFSFIWITICKDINA